MTYKDLIIEILRDNPHLNDEVRFIWNGEPEYQLTFKGFTIQKSNDGERYILLDSMKKS